MEAIYPWVKILHIIAFTAWMAAIFYLPRLFINHLTAEPGGEADVMLQGMERRLLKGIMTPSMIATWIFGLTMVGIQSDFGNDGWFLIKLAAVLVITGIHGFYSKSQKAFERGERPRSDRFWRVINEVPILLMLVIVPMVILKPLVF